MSCRGERQTGRRGRGNNEHKIQDTLSNRSISESSRSFVRSFARMGAKVLSLCLNGQGGRHLPAGEDAGGGEEDDGYWVGGAQQAVAVEGGRDLPPELLAQRHPGAGGQLPAIRKHSEAKDGASRRIQGPVGGSDTHVKARRMSADSFFLPATDKKPWTNTTCCDLVLCLQPAAKTDAALLDKNVGRSWKCIISLGLLNLGLSSSDKTSSETERVCISLVSSFIIILVLMRLRTPFSPP